MRYNRIMELKELIEVFTKNKKLIIKIAIGFGLLGLLFYAVPKPYKAVGTFYVTRGIDLDNKLDFTYEGFYAQQAGTNYAETLTGLMESVDIRREVLDVLKLPVTESALRELARSIKTKKTAPQLVTLTVKADSNQGAKRLWLAVADATEHSSRQLNSASGDGLLQVARVSPLPVVYAGYNSLVVFVGVSLALARCSPSQALRLRWRLQHNR